MNSKINLNYTGGLVSLPDVDKNFNMMVWCPMMIKMKENNSFKQQDLNQTGLTQEQKEIIKHVPIYEALNTENYRYSLKEAYKSKSMSPSMIFDRSDVSDSDSSEEQIQIEESNGKKITKTKS